MKAPRRRGIFGTLRSVGAIVMGATALLAIATLLLSSGSEDARAQGEETCWTAYHSAMTLADTQRVDNRLVTGPEYVRENARRCRDVPEAVGAVQRHRARQAGP
jgi:hypothetical protein